MANSDTTYSNTGRSLAGYNHQVGDGVKYSECRHVRDTFLDFAYRMESGRLSYYETSYSAVLELEDIMGEFDGAAFSKSVSGLWVAMQELAKSPNDVTNISMLVSKAATFIENASAVYKSFQEYQNNLNRQVKDSVKDINAIGKRIDELNKQIMKIEVGGQEHANDLRDERDALIDTLSGYGNVTFREEPNKAVTVYFNGVDFVNDGSYNEMKLLTNEENGYVTPYWPHNLLYKEDKNGNRVPDYDSALVFNLTDEISTANNTDVGSLRALLLARGDHVADYTDLTVGACTDRKLDTLEIGAEKYNDKAGLEYYDKYISNSIVMNAEAEFDNLVHSIITKVNEVLAENCDPKSGYLCNDDGTPMQMFVKSGSPAYERVVLTKKKYRSWRLREQSFIRFMTKTERRFQIHIGSMWKRTLIIKPRFITAKIQSLTRNLCKCQRFLDLRKKSSPQISTLAKRLWKHSRKMEFTSIQKPQKRVPMKTAILIWSIRWQHRAMFSKDCMNMSSLQ